MLSCIIHYLPVDDIFDLVLDFSLLSNPNGPWQYGIYTGNQTSPGTFTPFRSTFNNTNTNLFSPGNVNTFSKFWGINENTNPADDGFIYKSVSTQQECGVPPGGVSLEGDWGTPAAQFTIPRDAIYNAVITFGNDGDDFTFTPFYCCGNYPPPGRLGDARVALTLVGNGTILYVPKEVRTNTYEVSIGPIGNPLLTTGTTIIAYVPQRGGCGNVNTNFRVTAVPIPV